LLHLNLSILVFLSHASISTTTEDFLFFPFSSVSGGRGVFSLTNFLLPPRFSSLLLPSSRVLLSA
jgi:hypothetical protein